MHKIIKEQTFEEGKTYTVILKTKQKEYKGIARCHPDDNYNWMHGYNIAKERALIKYLKDEVAYYNAQEKALYHVLDCLRQNKNFSLKDKATNMIHYNWILTTYDLACAKADLKLQEAFLNSYIK